MNTISTVGDLQAALAGYPHDAPLNVLVDHKCIVFNNDLQIYAEFDSELRVRGVRISLHTGGDKS